MGGISNYGECDEARAFCENHDLSYLHGSEAGSEWDACTYYWAPGMKEVLHIKGDRDNDPVVNVSIIKPYTDLLLATSRKGQGALPLFINSSNDDLKKLVKKGLTMKFDKFLVMLQKKLGSPTIHTEGVTMKVLDINGVAGPMRVLFVPKGEPSPNHKNSENKTDSVVEFYDGRYPHTPEGQFISRYYVGTLLESEGSGRGLDLNGGVPNWKVYGTTMDMVRDWVRYWDVHYVTKGV
jgi:hypothetical protein